MLSIYFSSQNPKKLQYLLRNTTCQHKLKYKITYQHLFISYVYYIEQIKR